MKVKAVPVTIGSRMGYDLVVTDPEATLQDYLDTVNKIIEEGGLFRSRAQVASCEGCPGCCSERIPLTSIDICKLMENPDIQADLGGDQNLNRFLGRYTQVIVEGQAVDIILGTKPDGSCLFLDPQNSKCRIYQWRPLVCQTFICSPASHKAKVFREQVVNQGEDQLVRAWLQEALYQGKEPVIHQADDPDLRAEDWPETAFSGVTAYADMKLRDICSDSLWKSLYHPDIRG